MDYSESDSDSGYNSDTWDCDEESCVFDDVSITSNSSDESGSSDDDDSTHNSVGLDGDQNYNLDTW